MMIKEAQQIIDNARSWMGKGITYQMGADNLKKMDCSAFIWRCLGERKYNGKVWRNTDWLCSPPALGDFIRLPHAEDGCIVVYPSYKDSKGKRRAGHVAVVVDAEHHTIIDCSQSQNGIAERNGDFFWKKTTVVFLKPA